MVSILVVADNRMFTRRVYSLLDGSPDLVLHVAFHSTDIFEAYLQYRPDIILLDSEIYLPLTAILIQFTEYGWDCPFFISGPTYLSSQMYPQLIPVDLEQDDIRATALSYLRNRNRTLMPESVPMYVTSAEGSPIFEADMYYLMLSVCLSSGDDALSETMLRQLKTEWSMIGQVEICSVFGRDILILMRKTTMCKHREFVRIHEILSRVTGLSYCSLYCDKVPLDDLDKMCQELLNQSARSYCIGSKCLHLNDLPDNRYIADSYTVSVRMIECVFERNRSALVKTLREFYQNQIIQPGDLQSLNQFHSWQHCALYVILKKYVDEPTPLTHTFSSAEQECDVLCQYWLDLLTRYQSNPYPAVSESAILYILKQYTDPQLSLDSISRKLGFAKSYISRSIKESLGVSFVELLQQARIEQSVLLLRTTDYTVKDIAPMVGYTDAQYFSKVFRRSTGIHPTDYRKHAQKEGHYAGVNS